MSVVHQTSFIKWSDEERSEIWVQVEGKHAYVR